MKPVVVSSLKKSYGLMVDYVPIVSARDHTSSAAPAVGRGFMSVPNVNDNLRLPPELLCTARNYRSGNGCWQSIT